MKRGGPLKRTAWIARGTKPLKRGKPMPKVSRRQREGGRTFWRRRRAEALERDGGRCQCKGCEKCQHWAGEPCTRSSHFHVMDVDHVEVLGIGGSRYNPKDPRNDLDNLQTLCRPCHRRKHRQDGPRPSLQSGS